MKFDYDKIPEHMMISMKNYIEGNYPLGGFLTAVFANDLFAAVKHADDTNIVLIPTYVSWIYGYAPHSSHGSYERVEEYFKKKNGEKNEQ